MKYTDFITIAKYLNKINQSKFTENEIKEKANDLWLEYQASQKAGVPTDAMVNLCNELYTDMDFMDYADLPPFMAEIHSYTELVHILRTALDYVIQD